MKTQAAVVCLSGVMLFCLANGSPQKPEQRTRTWLAYAESLTDDLVYDAFRLDRYDRALMWARLGDIWWRADPARARQWYLKAVQLVEVSADHDKRSLSCRLATARILLGVISAKDKELYERLVSVIGADKELQNSDQRTENATALAAAGLSLVENDPQGALRFGEASLRLGFSIRLANLLWALRRRDPESANTLFMQVLQVATVTGDFNFFSMLTSAAFRGPYSSDRERRQVLSALAQVLQRPRGSPADAVAVCKLSNFVPPLLTYFDTLLPEESTKVKLAMASCQATTAPETAHSTDTSVGGPAAETIEELLSAASKTTNQVQRGDFLLKAALKAAQKKDFERAVRILDSIDEEGRTRLGDSWEAQRWDFASSLACEHLKFGDRLTMSKVIDSTPSNLRALVVISMATNCNAVSDNVLASELLERARKELDSVKLSERSAWHMNLVRLYVKFSPSTVPAVLSEAIAAINREPNEATKTCDSENSIGGVLTHQVLLNRFRLPASLLETDEDGIRSAIGSIRPPDARAAIRLQLLAGALEEDRRASRKVKTSKTTK